MYVFGKNVAKELISNNKEIKKAYILNTLKDDTISKNLTDMNVMVSYLTKNEMDRLEKGNHQGYILEIPDFKVFNI